VIAVYKITKWCKSITDDGKDKIICKKPEGLNFKFRLLDDDGIIYAYGYADSCDDEKAFQPLDRYMPDYGCTEIQYKNPISGKWETL
jgi:hypothetical protein